MATKSKSMVGDTSERKLAANHGRKKAKSGAEQQKDRAAAPKTRHRRTGSSKQRKS